MQYKHQTLVLGFNIICVSFSLSNMKSPSILNFAVSLPFFCMLFFFWASTVNPIFGLKNCNFPAIFNFGDSNSDTGGLSDMSLKTPTPYGETYFHKPAGWFSDDWLMIDFMGMYLVSLSIS